MTCDDMWRMIGCEMMACFEVAALTAALTGALLCANADGAPAGALTSREAADRYVSLLIAFNNAVRNGFADQGEFDAVIRLFDGAGHPEHSFAMGLLFPKLAEGNPDLYARITAPRAAAAAKREAQDNGGDGQEGGDGTPAGETGRGGETPEAGPPQVVFQAAFPPAPDYPVCFTNNPGLLVQTVMLAVIGDAADLATLIDAPETARLRIVPDGAAEPAMTAQERSLTAQFVPAQWLVAEVDFDAPVPLGSLFFGDTAGRPLWERGWQGGIAGIVCFDAPPDADVRAGVANYLSLRGEFRGYPATYAQKKAAIAAGLNYGLVWGTLIIVR